MKPNLWNHRKSLSRTLSKIKEGRLTLGFIGGSITDARPRHNWPEMVIAWFVDSFPGVRIVVENAAIGATGSDLAVLRAKRDLIDRGCDIVFIDYAVNDNDMPADYRNRTREGLIRKLLEGEGRDLVFVYTYCQDMYNAMITDGVPDSIMEFEQLADHYGAGSVWMGLYALEEIKKGKLRWEEWLPDGLHPTSRGSLVYGESVIGFLQQELNRPADPRWDEVRAAGMADPLHERHWGESTLLPLERIETEGPWTLRRFPYYEWIDMVLETAAVGAKMSFTFEGRGLALGFDFGKASAEYRYRIDGGEWIPVERDRPDWLGNDGWFRLSFLGDDLEPGSHSFELEVTHGNKPGCTGTNFRLGIVGVIR